jgi:hypothetical protein
LCKKADLQMNHIASGRIPHYNTLQTLCLWNVLLHHSQLCVLWWWMSVQRNRQIWDWTSVCCDYKGRSNELGRNRMWLVTKPRAERLVKSSQESKKLENMFICHTVRSCRAQRYQSTSNVISSSQCRDVGLNCVDE